MNAIVFEHVQLSDLPASWRSKLAKALPGAARRVTVRIEEEAESSNEALDAIKANPLFGMWAKRQDMDDVAGHVRNLRAPRLNADGTKTKK